MFFTGRPDFTQQVDNGKQQAAKSACIAGIMNRAGNNIAVAVQQFFRHPPGNVMAGKIEVAIAVTADAEQKCCGDNDKQSPGKRPAHTDRIGIEQIADQA